MRGYSGMRPTGERGGHGGLRSRGADRVEGAPGEAAGNGGGKESAGRPEGGSGAPGR